MVLTRSGKDYDPSRPLEEQPRFTAHAEYMDALVDAGFLILGGPLADERRVVYVVEADTEDEVRKRVSGDPWFGSHLELASIDPWAIRLDGR